VNIIVESFRAIGEKSGSSIRVRPLPDQGFDVNMRVECSKKMRYAFPVGQKFLVEIQVKSMLGGPDHLYSSYRNPWNPVDDQEAAKFIAKTFRIKG
jgi:hypothetical protein